jgi:hypothetical protein
VQQRTALHLRRKIECQPMLARHVAVDHDGTHDAMVGIKHRRGEYLDHDPIVVRAATDGEEARAHRLAADRKRARMAFEGQQAQIRRFGGKVAFPQRANRARTITRVFAHGIRIGAHDSS